MSKFGIFKKVTPAKKFMTTFFDSINPDDSKKKYYSMYVQIPPTVFTTTMSIK